MNTDYNQQNSYKDIALSDLGQILPIGIFINDKKINDYALTAYNVNHDISLGRLEDENKEHEDKINRVFSAFLPTIISDIGGYTINDLAKKLDTSPNLLIREMYLADVMTLILTMRMRSHGSLIALSGTCPCHRQKKIKGGEDGAGFHDLKSIMIRCWTGARSPRFTVSLEEPVTWNNQIINEIVLRPPKFRNILSLSDEDIAVEHRLLFTCSTPQVNEDFFYLLSADDIFALEAATKQLYFGPDREIEMDCDYINPVTSAECGFSWKQPLDHGSYEAFYCYLASPPRAKDKIGAVEEYYTDLAFFVATGEQTHLSYSDVLMMSPSTLKSWVEKLSKLYKDQKAEMDKANAQAKAKRSRKR